MVFVLGGPGSGKGTQCAKLVTEFHFKHLSTGDLLREEAKKETEEGKKIAATLKEGKLVSSETLVNLIKAAFKTHGGKGRFLLDGFPRSEENVTVWNKLMKTEANVACLLFFSCTEEVMIKRLTARSTTSGRTDDTPETIKARIALFNKESVPVKAHYKGEKLIEVKADGEVDAVYKELREHIVKKKLDKDIVVEVKKVEVKKTDEKKPEEKKPEEKKHDEKKPEEKKPEEKKH